MVKTQNLKTNEGDVKTKKRSPEPNPRKPYGRGPVVDEKLDLASLPRARQEKMLEAGVDVLECQRVLGKTGSNVVAEVLHGQGPFFKWNHYPKGDVYDPDTHSQYFYHSHRSGEHGHFHIFLRAKGMPKGVKPVECNASVEWPCGDKALSHLIAISMDARGFPIRLFTTNRWVTGETWYGADDVREMVDRFLIDHTYPSWPTNRWINGMMRLFAPDIAMLLRNRDAFVDDWSKEHPGTDVYEDRGCQITSYRKISVKARVRALCDLLD